MSRDCVRPSRKRAGSDCSQTSPRVGRKSECLGPGDWAGGLWVPAGWALATAGRQGVMQPTWPGSFSVQAGSCLRSLPTVLDSALSSEHLLLSAFLEQAFRPFPFKGFFCRPQTKKFISPEL